nr:hypothetical protein [Fulvimarina manganoxydans]
MALELTRSKKNSLALCDLNRGKIGAFIIRRPAESIGYMKEKAWHCRLQIR